jgi:hypothetical protein
MKSILCFENGLSMKNGIGHRAQGSWVFAVHFFPCALSPVP